MGNRVTTATTTKHLRYLLPSALQKIGRCFDERPDLILATWPLIVGHRLAPMTKAVSFRDGVLTIKVRNSSLLSLLAQHEHARLLRELRRKFPKAKIHTIRFGIG